MRCVTATVGVGDLATKGIVGNGIGDGGDRDGLQLDTVTRDRQRSVGSVWDGLARGDERRRDKQFVFGYVASHVGEVGTSRKQGDESGKLARGGSNERRDGRVGTGDNVCLGEPDDGVV